MGTAMGMRHLQALLQKLQEAQDNPSLAPLVHDLLATRDLELRYNTRLPSRLGESLPKEGQERGTNNVPLREKIVPLSPRSQREGAMKQPCQEPLATTLNERGKNKERSILPKQGRKQRRSQEPSLRRRRASSHDSTSSSRSGRNPHGRFYKERRNAPSPPHDSSSLNDTSSSSSSNESFSSSSIEERRKKKRKHDHHKSKSMAKKGKKKKKRPKFREGSKNVPFITYDGTYGAIDKVLAFIQQFDAAFGGEDFTESSKLRSMAMHLQKSARQWWASLKVQGKAPTSWAECREAILKQFLQAEAKDEVLTTWSCLKMNKNEPIQKYVEHFWDANLKAMVYKRIDFVEQRQQYCAGLTDEIHDTAVKLSLCTIQRGISTCGAFCNPTPSPQVQLERVFVPRNDQSAAFHGQYSNDTRKVRPADLQKWVKKFSGLGDPNDHLARFRQIIRAKKVTDFHILVEGFRLTLEGKALSWFQTLDVALYPTINALEKDFFAAFSKTGIKHNVQSQIYGFKQTKDKSMRDYANRLKQYLARCPKSKMPKQERLVSIFLEGLRNKDLHSALFMKYHKSLNLCIHKAIDYDDNCDKDADETRSKSGESSRKATLQIEDIIKEVVEKMQQMYGPPRATDCKIMRPYICGICGGDHPTSQCLPKDPRQIKQDPQLALWCDFHKRWSNHATKNCYNRIHHMREQAMGNAFRVGMEGEKPAPVLDRQPPLPNAAPVRLLNWEDDLNLERALVPVSSYEDDQMSFQGETSESWRSPMVSYQDGQYSMDMNTLMFIAEQGWAAMPQASKRPLNAPLGPCYYNCQGDHLIKDCLYPRQPNRPYQQCLLSLDIAWTVV
ncbi:hypothetical protein L7F22_002317 [Adiantum nelumboides]|nr:hypothetical protein [Adiantum nelumboides]